MRAYFQITSKTPCVSITLPRNILLHAVVLIETMALKSDCKTC